MPDAATIIERIERLGSLSEEPDRLTRRYGTPALRQAMALMQGWMEAAGLHVVRDGFGNLRGRLEDAGRSGRTLLLGSHLDSVRDAGKYDGPLGVLVALAALERLKMGDPLPFAVELLCFADEEGLRFHSLYLGSEAVVGHVDAAVLERMDDDGTSLASAIRAFGGDPGEIPNGRIDPAGLLGYFEVHIEQGPILEAEGLPVGIVTAITSQDRVQVEFRGMAGHAGTVPPPLRQDALCAAAEFVLAVEQVAGDVEGLVATVGQLRVEPGASNVIPGLVVASLDVRHQQNEIRAAATLRLQRLAADIAQRRSVDLRWQLLQSSAPVPCDARLMAVLEAAIQAQHIPVRRLVSGAGHDGVIMARITPIAMLFVRCAGGISHNPAESVLAVDISVALDVTERFVRLLAARMHDEHL
ncbi:MAG: allantoate amidohydrolase [Herpetosiphon sp.]